MASRIILNGDTSRLSKRLCGLRSTPHFIRIKQPHVTSPPPIEFITAQADIKANSHTFVIQNRNLGYIVSQWPLLRQAVRAAITGLIR